MPFLPFHLSRVCWRALVRGCVVGLLAVCGFAQETSPGKVNVLAKPPDWQWLESAAGVLTRSEFESILQTVYAPDEASRSCVQVGASSARIRIRGEEWREVPFVPEGRAVSARFPRFWRAAGELPPAPFAAPLRGIHIALDPGHLGGQWARMEERFFQVGKSRPVTEGDLTLAVARRLQPQLERLGAKVTLLRSGDRPVTRERPKTLHPVAAADLDAGAAKQRIQQHSEMLFYRISEIRARANRVNEEVRPDLVVCLHLNAEDWQDPQNPKLLPRNHLHALINGCYGARELEWDDVRSEMLEHLFSRTHAESLPLTESVVDALAEGSGLPPFTYFSSNARRIGESPYVYTRNLLANRLYRAPVVFLEPYVMNSEPVWKRVQMGDYSGQREVFQVRQASLVREYAGAVAEGLARYYRTHRAIAVPERR
jgi:N-acetylmuramoyl-L-alanine amidase